MNPHLNGSPVLQCSERGSISQYTMEYNVQLPPGIATYNKLHGFAEAIKINQRGDLIVFVGKNLQQLKTIM